MNRRGFTLIELLAVIILVGIIGVIIIPNLLNTVSSSKEASYNMLIKNIVTSSQSYYEECEYGDLSSTEKYGAYACSITGNNTIHITLGDLANTGFLSVKDVDPNNKSKKLVLDPRNNNNISDCKIIITKQIYKTTDEYNIENIKVTYKVEPDLTIDGCPGSY